MIIESVLLAMTLSLPTITPESIDMHYKPCADLYKEYVTSMKEDRLRSKMIGKHLKHLCTPLRAPIDSGEH